MREAHLIIEHPAWTPHLSDVVRQALCVVCNHEQLWQAELSILCTSDAHIRMLNHNFRGADKATNVLAFPSGDAPYLGDIALSLDTLAREASAQHKKLEHHLAHLLIHSVLHLRGHDHEEAEQADAMEALEIKLLHRLGIENPYL